MTRRMWTDSDREVLRRTYADYPTESIARSLGRSIGQVHQQAQSLGLRKSVEFIARTARERAMRPDHGSHATRFQPGLVPENKGLRRPGWAPGEMARTQFKPGIVPHTWKPIGALRLSKDGYLERKVSEDSSRARRWVAEHRLVWLAINGHIPDGCAIVFRPGQFTADLDQITTDRLECLTRAELMRRNTIHRYPEPVKQVMRLRGKLSRAISAQEDQA
ncbi:MAG: hypothetical protein RJA63_37 [Pseudomonadota bacterium]|jgi:hypothetical protein